MKDIDWIILQTLYAKGSITKAAESLYMTQSALTKRIKSIEEEWKVKIVQRNSKGVIFTEEGRFLVKKANIMLDFLGEIHDHFSGNSVTKTLLRMGVPNSFARLYMPRLFNNYMKKYDYIQFKLISNSSDILVQQLTDGTIDIAIVCGDYPYIGKKVCLFQYMIMKINRY